MPPKNPLGTGQGTATPSTRTLYLDLRGTVGDTAALPGATNTRQVHTLDAKPFNHLSVWAYLAFAFIVLALITVFAYLMYSCYHTAKGRMDAELVSSGTNEIREENVFCDDGGKLNSTRPGGLTGSVAMARMSDRVADAGEKMKTGSAKIGRTVLEMKGFGGGSHQRNHSESQYNITSLPHDSQSSLCNTSDTSFDLDNHGLASPPLALTSDRAATYIPFHLPPPPPSPTPAHKQHVERQYGGQAQQSPVSPSPSFTFACSPPPITPRLKPAIRYDTASWSGRTAVGSDHWSHSKRKNKRERPEENEPPVEFDSNNIRFVPPLNPFMTPSAALIWNDPKLSPIHGSIITTGNTSNVSDTTLAEESSFARVLTAALKTPPSSASPRKRVRLALPAPDSLDCDDKENVNLPPPKEIATPAKSGKRRRGNDW